jgi:peptidoglycan/LPS O-acetylase OafA/YrhL
MAAAWRSLCERPAGHLRALDGLRALAILMVLATHAAMPFEHLGGAPSALLQSPVIRAGWVGVPLFFTLSGFLIGRQLWAELAAHGRVDAPRFLLRRGLRIWPLYYLLLAVFSVLPPPNGTPYSNTWPEWLFLSNYQSGPLIRADWSLATEEQFYLAAALLFAVAGRHLLPGRRFPVLCLILLALAPLSRVLTLHHAGTAAAEDVMWRIAHLYRPMHTHFDGLVGGLLIAWLIARPGDPIREAGRRVPAPVVLLACVLGAAILRVAAPLTATYTALALVFGALVWMAASGGGGWFVRLLSSTPLHVVSKLSYGIYLVHERLLPELTPAVVRATRGLPGSLQFAVMLGVALAGSLAVATLTYFLIERPFLGLRSRWSLTRTA